MPFIAPAVTLFSDQKTRPGRVHMGRLGLSLFLVVVLVSWLQRGASCRFAPDLNGLSCAHAPTKTTVVQIPRLVADWVSIICLPTTGQAIVPQVDKHTSVWIATAKRATFRADGGAPGWKKPDGLSSYDVRFAGLLAHEQTGDNRERELKCGTLGLASHRDRRSRGLYNLMFRAS